MRLGDVLHESGSSCGMSISPRRRIISLLYVMEDGASAGIAIVGNEGILGISLFMGGKSTPSRAVVQSTALLPTKADLLKMSLGVSVRRCIFCCVIPRR